jgi:hypothetical protein
MNPPEIQGHVHPRFTRVRDVFAKQFRSGREIGATVGCRRCRGIPEKATSF